ncbi:cell division protein FtsZ [Asticcacaulis machinosus]|uniref:Cell division protein FtsZ n=1 Tax=Asticcacaulis machinosus TaxID=2984211 RepID=A0ABT5HMW6_9CAUL|nr:cell division protein FtsZ [Asticcacaulis machinosus]MDC7677567.1 cell division protein FtsZ [Asticcacaulis machinosus]
MAIHLSAPRTTELKPRIVVFGVGGAGGNAVNNMIESGLEGVEFVVANTDAQQLQFAKTDRKIQLGVSITQGLGAGAHPEVGMTAAEESHHEITEHLDGAHMVFITAGMGGGTGTGAAPIIAKCARERGILTVGVVTKPFMFEGRHRMRLADAGISELQRYVDTLIVIPNQNLFRIANERTTFAEAFGMADQVLHSGVRSITDLMVLPGLINLDFADVRSVMSEMGKAMMGTGEASGDDRAMQAAQNAIQNPLLDETSLKGAKAVLVNVTGGLDMTLLEVDEAANAISSEVDPDANIIFGAAFDPSLEGKLRVSVVATGMDSQAAVAQPPVQTATPAQPQPTVQAAPKSPLFTGGSSREPQQAQPANVQPASVSAPVFASAPAPAITPVPAPAAREFGARIEPVAPREPLQSMARPAFTAPAEAAKTEVPESRVIGKIVDPEVEGEEDGLFSSVPDQPVAPAAPRIETPRVEAPRAQPEIVRPTYPQPPRPTFAGNAPRPEPARPTVQAPTHAPARPPEEEKGSIWRSLFPQRNRDTTSHYAPVTQQPSVQPSYPAQPEVTDHRSATVSVTKPEMSAAPEAEDDLEIPSFLRRLAN